MKDTETHTLYLSSPLFPLRIKLPIQDNMFVILDRASLIHGTVREMEIAEVEGYTVRGFAFYSKNAV